MQKHEPIQPTPAAIAKVERAEGQLPPDASREEQLARYQLWQAQTLIDLYELSVQTKDRRRR
jgi:hypothetical protein